MNCDESDISNKDLYILLQNVMKKNEEIHNQNIEIKNAINTIKEEYEHNIAAIKSECNNLREENIQLKKRVLNLERKTKKYNIVIYGLKECSLRKEEETEIQNLFNRNLELNYSPREIRDFYRIGKKDQNKCRPLLVEFNNYSTRDNVFQNISKLKNTKFFITPDLTPEDYSIQKSLRNTIKVVKEKYPQAYIKKNILFVNRQQFAAEEINTLTIPILEYLTAVFEDKQSLSIDNIANESSSTRKKKEISEPQEHTGVKRSARLNSKK